MYFLTGVPRNPRLKSMTSSHTIYYAYDPCDTIFNNKISVCLLTLNVLYGLSFFQYSSAHASNIRAFFSYHQSWLRRRARYQTRHGTANYHIKWVLTDSNLAGMMNYYHVWKIFLLNTFNDNEWRVRKRDSFNAILKCYRKWIAT